MKDAHAVSFVLGTYSLLKSPVFKVQFKNFRGTPPRNRAKREIDGETEKQTESETNTEAGTGREGGREVGREREREEGGRERESERTTPEQSKRVNSADSLSGSQGEKSVSRRAEALMLFGEQYSSNSWGKE